MDAGQDWRDLVHAYVTAFCDDYRKRFADKVEGREARFLAWHAADSQRQEFIRAAKSQFHRIGEPGPKEDIAIVEQFEGGIVAEAPAHRSSHDVLCPIPVQPTRFVLTNTQADWLIESIFQPCTSCNFSPLGPNLPVIARTPGRRSICCGQGELMKGHPCRSCDGKGTCPRCSGEKTPGWIRMVSIEYLRPVTGVAESPSS